MTAHPYILYGGKVASLVIAGVSAILASLLSAFYAIALCGSAIEGATIGIVFGAVALTTLAALTYGFSKLKWVYQVWVGAVLLAACFTLLPRATCAAEDQTTSGC